MTNLFTARIVLGSAIILAIAAAAIGATFAFLSDTENSEGNTFDAGVLDLKIDNTSYYNGAESPTTTWTLDDLDGHLFFDFRDVKPGDWGEDTISIHVQTNDAYACFDTTLITDDDTLTNNLELEAGDTADTASLLDGELGGAINFVFWADDGDNVLEDDEDNILSEGPANVVLNGLSVTLADSLENLFGGNPGDPLDAEHTYYIAKAWCFGTLGQVPLEQDGLGADSPRNPSNSTGGVSCDGSALGNITQSDSLTADVMFSAIQHRGNPDFVCDDETPPQVSCELPDQIYAASVVSSAQGLRRNGTNVIPDRTNPASALGAPQTAGLPSDVGFPVGSFFSLGFPHANNGGTPGSVIYDMGETFYPNPSGPDLFIYEVTGGTYPDETVTVEAKLAIGDSWTPLGSVTRDGNVEILPLVAARYVRLTEASPTGSFEATADGYDLDAIKAFCTQIENQ